MKKSISLRCFPATASTERRLTLARDAGFAAVEINLEPTAEFSLESSKDELRRLERIVAESGLAVSAVYNRQQWRFPINSLSAATREHGANIVKGLIDVAARLGTATVLVVPGIVDNGLFVDPPEHVPYQTAYENSLEALKRLSAYAERRQITLAIENVWNKFLLSPLEIRDFLAAVDSPSVAMYFDVGNARRAGFPEDWISILAAWIHAVQVKDFRCAIDNKEGFVGLLQGDVDWPAVRMALETIGYDGWITGEVLPAYSHHGERLVYETSAAIDAIFDGYAPSTPS